MNKKIFSCVRKKLVVCEKNFQLCKKKNLVVCEKVIRVYQLKQKTKDYVLPKNSELFLG